MKRLFENKGGKNFKLLTENQVANDSLVQSGLEKVFKNGGQEISYDVIENVGLAYIKDVRTAQETAVRVARELASKFGFTDDENSEKFVKSNTGESNQAIDEIGESNTDVNIIDIANRLLKLAKRNTTAGFSDWKYVEELATKLLQSQQK